MKIKFRRNNKVNYMQDYSFLAGIPNGINFDVKFIDKDRISLSAKGYGDLSGKGNYGNGALFVLVKNLPRSLKNRVELKMELDEEKMKLEK